MRCSSDYPTSLLPATSLIRSLSYLPFCMIWNLAPYSTYQLINFPIPSIPSRLEVAKVLHLPLSSPLPTSPLSSHLPLTHLQLRRPLGQLTPSLMHFTKWTSFPTTLWIPDNFQDLEIDVLSCNFAKLNNLVVIFMRLILRSKYLRMFETKQ